MFRAYCQFAHFVNCATQFEDCQFARAFSNWRADCQSAQRCCAIFKLRNYRYRARRAKRALAQLNPLNPDIVHIVCIGLPGMGTINLWPHFHTCYEHGGYKKGTTGGPFIHQWRTNVKSLKLSARRNLRQLQQAKPSPRKKENK